MRLHNQDLSYKDRKANTENLIIGQNLRFFKFKKNVIYRFYPEGQKRHA